MDSYRCSFYGLLKGSSMVQLIVYLLLVIVISALCSLVETAITAVSVTKARHLVEQNVSGAEALLHIKRNNDQASSTVVILNNLSNIAGSMLVMSMVIDLFGNHWVEIFSGVMTFVIIIFAEILPKNIGFRYSVKIALRSSQVMMFVMMCMYPIVAGVKWFISIIVEAPKPIVIEERDVLSSLKLA